MCIYTTACQCLLLFSDVYIYYTVLLAGLKRMMSTTTFWCIRYWLQDLIDWCPLLLTGGLMSTTTCRYQWVDFHWCLMPSVGWCPLIFLLMYTLRLPALMVWCPLLIVGINGLMSTTESFTFTSAYCINKSFYVCSLHSPVSLVTGPNLGRKCIQVTV